MLSIVVVGDSGHLHNKHEYLTLTPVHIGHLSARDIIGHPLSCNLSSTITGQGFTTHFTSLSLDSTRLGHPQNWPISLPAHGRTLTIIICPNYSKLSAQCTYTRTRGLSLITEWKCGPTPLAILIDRNQEILSEKSGSGVFLGEHIFANH